MDNNDYNTAQGYTQGDATSNADAAYTQNAEGANVNYGESNYGGSAQNPYSVQSPYSDNIPPEIKKWNWGAFIFNAYWGFGNRAYLALLCLIPYFGFIWMFVCGFKGNEWAWKSGTFKDVETFLAVQKTWNKGGLVNFIVSATYLSAYFMVIDRKSVV